MWQRAQRSLKRAWEWCFSKRGIPEVPRFEKLDKADDGTLDLRTWAFSGRFRSPKLEAEYRMYQFAIWRPRFRIILGGIVTYETYAIIDSLICQCGVRYGMFDGPWLAYTFSFPVSMLLLAWAMLSPNRSVVRFIAPKAWPIFGTHAMLLVCGYLIPATVYLQSHPLSDSAKQTMDAFSLANASLWHLATLNLMCAMLATLSAGLAIGAFALLLFLALPFGLFVHYFAVHTQRLHEGLPHSLLPCAAVTFGINVILGLMHETSTRQQYLVRIYAAHLRDLRLDQLQQEKERLDYERRFALQELGEGGSFSRGRNARGSREQLADGAAVDDIEVGTITSDAPELQAASLPSDRPDRAGPSLGSSNCAGRLQAEVGSTFNFRSLGGRSVGSSSDAGTEFSDLAVAAAALAHHPTSNTASPDMMPGVLRTIALPATLLSEDRLESLWRTLKGTELLTPSESDGASVLPEDGRGSDLDYIDGPLAATHC